MGDFVLGKNGTPALMASSTGGVTQPKKSLLPQIGEMFKNPKNLKAAGSNILGALGGLFGGDEQPQQQYSPTGAMFQTIAPSDRQRYQVPPIAPPMEPMDNPYTQMMDTSLWAGNSPQAPTRRKSPWMNFMYSK